jgi:NAD(P)H-flavin reductase
MDTRANENTTTPVVAADPMLPRLFRVVGREEETADTATIDVAPVDGRPAGRFVPGQFNMLYLFGRGEVPISISSDPGVSGELAHTIRAVGNVTHGLADLSCGEVIGLRGPFGSGWPMPTCKDRDVLVIAGGLGLAPLRPAICYLIARRERYRRIAILYGARSPADLLFRSDLLHWRESSDVSVDITVDHADSGWHGNVGVITPLVARAEFDAARAVALVCGPGIMMRFVASTLQRRGLVCEQIYVSLERNMKCAIAHCGRCQLGPLFICKDGPVVRYDRVRSTLGVPEV